MKEQTAKDGTAAIGGRMHTAQRVNVDIFPNVS